jgi:hypothetical protein
MSNPRLVGPIAVRFWSILVRDEKDSLVVALSLSSWLVISSSSQMDILSRFHISGHLPGLRRQTGARPTES